MAATEEFEPSIGDVIRLFGEELTVQEHPNARGLVFAATGGRADVYQLADRQKRRWGLKVFFAKFRNELIVESTKHLQTIENFAGLMVARRRVVTPDEGDARRYKNLHYAVLMPWVPGRTWYDSLEQRRLNDLAHARGLANRFLRVVRRLEEAGIAHTDISSGNVSFEHKSEDTQLLDLEDMYIPNAPMPKALTTGTPGYNHPAKATTWRPSGDRYAAAILAAEILLMSDKTLAGEVTSGSFFTENRVDDTARGKFKKAEPYLHEIAPKFGELLTAAWNSDSLDDCPRIQILDEGLSRDLSRVVSPHVQTPYESSPQLPLPTLTRKPPVTWAKQGVSFEYPAPPPTDRSKTEVKVPVLAAQHSAPVRVAATEQPPTRDWRWLWAVMLALLGLGIVLVILLRR